MTANEIALIITSSTALITILAQIVTARITAKSAERIKQIEMQTPRAFDALNEFVDYYSNLTPKTDSRSYLPQKYEPRTDSAYKIFVESCHKLIPFIKDPSLQVQICNFMEHILENGKCTSHETDLEFDVLTIKIGAAIIQSRKHAKNYRSKPRKQRNGN